MKQVIPIVGFTSTIDGVKYRAQAGVPIGMPKGADWVTAGLARLAEDDEKPAAKKNKAKTSKKGK